MGKGLLLVVAACCLTGAFSLYSLQRGKVMAQKEISTYQKKALAREAALWAYQRGYRWTQDQWEKSRYIFTDTLTGRYQGGAYTVRIQSSKMDNRLTADIVAEGLYSSQTHQVDASISSEVGPKVPPFLRFALMSDQDLNLNGNALVTHNDPDKNANVHTNGALLIDGRTNQIQGFGTYAKSKTISPSGAEADIFKPKNNPYNRSLTKEVSPTEVTPLDAPTYRDSAHKVTSGDLSFSGGELIDFTVLSGALGTEEDPAIWYVAGDFLMSGNSTLKGHGIFIVEDSVKIAGTTATEKDLLLPGKMAIYTAGQILVEGGASLDAHFFANQDIYFDGKSEVRGSVAAGGFTFLNGTPDLYYQSIDVSLTLPVWPYTGIEDIILEDYKEW